MKRSLLVMMAWALVGCSQPAKPQPTPSPSATVAPTPTPTPAVILCPTVNVTDVKVACGTFSEQNEKTKWDCTPKWKGLPILPEGDPNRQFCELQVLGEKPHYQLVDVSGTLTLSLPQPKTGEPNPFQFFLSGSGNGKLVCPLASGYDPCRRQAVSR